MILAIDSTTKKASVAIKIDEENIIVKSIDNEITHSEKLLPLIDELLKENNLNNKQIAILVKCDPSVVSNINYGKAYFDSNLTYPIRKS